jgi:methionyl-tRNA formyltransferase
MTNGHCADSDSARQRVFVVGNGGFAVACIDRLVTAGWDVVGVFSPDDSLSEVANISPGTLHVTCREGVHSWLVEHDVGMLFSLNNSWIIPDETLKIPSLLAINYHDSPLPCYAGLHSTSWAILNSETMHAVTFHIVSPGIDTGDIVAQRVVPIYPQDTAFTLNARCFQNALSLFDDLIVDLGTGVAVVRTAQSQVGKSYFG